MPVLVKPCVLLFRLKKKVSMLRGATRYVEILYSTHLVSCEQTSFPAKTLLMHPVPIFFSGSVDANVMWLPKQPHKPVRGTTCASHLSTELLHLPGDLISFYDLGCFSDIPHKGQLDTQLVWPLLLCFVVLCFQGASRRRSRFTRLW